MRGTRPDADLGSREGIRDNIYPWLVRRGFGASSIYDRVSCLLRSPIQQQERHSCPIRSVSQSASYMLLPPWRFLNQSILVDRSQAAGHTHFSAGAKRGRSDMTEWCPCNTTPIGIRACMYICTCMHCKSSKVPRAWEKLSAHPAHALTGATATLSQASYLKIAMSS
jgi:hypothetical protein